MSGAWCSILRDGCSAGGPMNARGIQTDASKFSGRLTLAQRKVLLNRVDVGPSARLDYCLSQISKSLSYLGLRVATGVMWWPTRLDGLASATS